VSELHVMDANFFISLAQTRELDAMETVLKLADGVGWEMHVTEPILEEVKYVRSKGSKVTAANLANRMMKVHPADDRAIASFRNELGGGQRAPQAPDLSLMVLADSLARSGATVRLVSDDFKISTSSRELGEPYAVISPSVFLFSLSRELKGEDRKNVRHLYKKVRHGEMEYVLSRADMYNVEDKLTWLMDNLLQEVTSPEAGPAPIPGAHVTGPALVAEGKEEDSNWEALVRHLRGEHVRRGHIKAFDPIMPYLAPLTDLRDDLGEVHKLADSGDLRGGLRFAHEVLRELKSELQLAVGGLDPKDGRKVMRAYAEMLPHLEMVTALLHINLGEVVDCEDHLDNVALLALAAGLIHTVIEANYLEALVHSYREAYEDALDQFRLTARLAELARDDDTLLRALIGTAVMQLFTEDREAAEEVMSRVNERVEADALTGSAALEEFGDHFTNFGATHLASGFYHEALECAVEAIAREDTDRLMGKLRRSRLSMGLEDREMAKELVTLMDMANDIQDETLQEYFRELEKDLERTLDQLDDPLEVTFDEWSPATKLPDALEDWLDIVRADPLPKGGGTMMVSYSQKMGNVGVLITDPVSLPGIEHAQIRLLPTSRVKLVEAPEPFKTGYRLRAIIVLHEGDLYEIQRQPIRLRRGRTSFTGRPSEA
jgi:tetratricopeptide (TPR) repeat protein